MALERNYVVAELTYVFILYLWKLYKGFISAVECQEMHLNNASGSSVRIRFGSKSAIPRWLDIILRFVDSEILQLKIEQPNLR